MKQKTDKNTDLEQIKSDLGEYPTVLICAFEGLKVEEDFQLRNQVREAGGRYRVVQNRLARLRRKTLLSRNRWGICGARRRLPAPVRTR